MFHEDTADRRKGDVITSGPQFCALRISALDRSKSRGQHGRSAGVTGGRPIDRIHRRYAARPKTSPVRNVVAKIFMPAGHSCVIEFEHISAALALPPPFAQLFRHPISPFPSFYAAIYTAIPGRRWKRKTSRAYFKRQPL